MSPADRRDLVLADLNAVLTGPASPSSIATAPYVSSRNGLCRRDVVALDYAREKDAKVDSSLKPVGVHILPPEYHFLGYENTGSGDVWQKACERLSGKEVYWARSDSDTNADFALAMLEETVADVRKKMSFTIDCKELGNTQIETRCASEFLATAPRVSAAYRCRDGVDQCYRFSFDQYEVTIVRTYSNLPNGGYSTAIKMEYAPIITT